MKTISKSEKADIFLALALLFKEKPDASGEQRDAEKVAQLAQKTFSAANGHNSELLESRAAFLDKLPEDKLRLWQEIQLKRLRQRGEAIVLDKNINMSHIAENLSREPRTIQKLILKNLPSDLSRRITKYLELYYSIEDVSEPENVKEKQIRNDIIALVKRKFLSDFVSFGDIYEPTATDKLSAAELEDFIYHLGLREVALACRGIRSKESLAAFLNRFADEDVRKIAGYITELEKIKPFWVEQADELVRKSWREDVAPEKVLKKVGFKILAEAFAKRGEAANRYTEQKLSAYDGKIWRKMVQQNETKISTGSEEQILIFTKRQRSVERLAVNFAQTGRL